MIDKLDVKILDIILDKVIESNSMINYRRFDEYEHFNYLSDEKRKLEFQRLIDYFENYNCARIIKHGYFNSLEKNQTTKRFKDNGGFSRIYQDELTRIEKENEIEVLTIQKLKWDAKLSKWQVKTFWYVFIFGLAGFILGIFNFVDNQKKTKSIEELQQNNQNIQEEVSKLRTLVLDQKTVDSLHNSKNNADSLSKK